MQPTRRLAGGCLLPSVSSLGGKDDERIAQSSLLGQTRSAARTKHSARPSTQLSTDVVIGTSPSPEEAWHGMGLALDRSTSTPCRAFVLNFPAPRAPITVDLRAVIRRLRSGARPTKTDIRGAVALPPTHWPRRLTMARASCLSGP